MNVYTLSKEHYPLPLDPSGKALTPQTCIAELNRLVSERDALAADNGSLYSAKATLIAERDRLTEACAKAIHPPEYDADDTPLPCSCRSCLNLRAVLTPSPAGGAE